MFSKATYILLILSVCYSTIVAQAQGELKFSRINSTSGLSNNNIWSLTSDKLGFIWAGTSDGLCRIETEDRIKVFRTGEDNSLKSNYIKSLLADRNGNLWIGTRQGGLTRFHQEKGTWKTFMTVPDDPSSISNNEVLSLLEDREGRIWVGTENGLNVYHPETESFTSFMPNIDQPGALQASAILCMMEDHLGRIWIGTWGGGFYLMLPSRTGKLKDATFKRMNPIADIQRSQNVWSLYQDQQKRYWVGTFGEGLFLMQLPEEAMNLRGASDWEPKFHQYHDADQSTGKVQLDFVLKIKQDSKGQLWIATTTGLKRIKENQLPDSRIYNRITTDKPSLSLEQSFSHLAKLRTIPHNMIYAMEVDADDIVWVGTFGGIGKYNPHRSKFEYFKLSDFDFSSHNAQNILVDKKDRCWVGNRDKGLLIYDPKAKEGRITTKALTSSQDARSLFSKDNKKLYIGTENGFLKMDMETKVSQHFPMREELQKLLSGFITQSLFVDSQERVWMGTDWGLFLFVPEQARYYYYTNEILDSTSISDNSVTQVYEDSNQNLWVSTYNGFNKIESIDSDYKIKFRQFKSDAARPDVNLPTNQIICISEAEGLLYLGLPIGLCSFDPITEKFNFLSKKGQQHFVKSIEKYEGDHFWGSVMAGIFSYNYKTKLFTLFNEEDGIIDKNFLSRSACQSNSGSIYFGSGSGFTRVDPDKIRMNEKVPPVYITDIKTIDPQGEHYFSGIEQQKLVLNHDEYYLSINFAALNFNTPKRNQYAYRLEGFEESWNYPETKVTSATYTNLDPGTYTFQVKAANNDGVWNDEGRSLIITVNPAYWETSWFRASILLVVALLLLAGIKLYTRSVRQRNQEMEELVNERTEELAKKNIQIEALFEEIKVRNIALEKMVARRTQSLKESNEELKRSNHDLEQFAYIASHDLQEPLRTVGSFVGLLGRQYKDQFDERAFQYIDFVKDGIERMSNLIKSILAYSKLGREKTSFKARDLNMIIGTKLLDLSQKIKEKKAIIQVQALPEIVCEGNQIGIVFFNLINNGLKFNKRKQPIIIVQEHTDGSDEFWKFSIADNGIGIEQEYQQKIFEIFRRLHLKSDYEGTGIGLAICQKIVENHGGEIWLNSIPGEGTTFFFTIKKELYKKTETEEEPISFKGEAWSDAKN
ncbi:MAG: two-component regulator propeller domain-containing protein [Saprospiraceae bacterium]